ncbi:PREDICTED: uncharacterized protein LOC107188942 [Dufourea novaeangliae]|uniref:uncharacterized protein LOC107188942 n=1 Tax=Dufourea novaeangliae TaxID=178035 RepID=UPI0007673F71|nr:PREDICTED: uncharacterized protein LOC107188942 [Dufourea novaeangliae]
MSAVYPALPKLAVRDGFDEEDLTDIDDEVFIRDGKNGGLKLDDDGGVKRPLMAPRRKCKKSYSFETYRFSSRTCYIPLCFGLMALIILLSLITLCIYIVNIIPVPMSILKNWLSHGIEQTLNESNIIPCTSLATNIVWTKSLPKLTSESPLRSSDVNEDGVEDIIVGFSTGLDTMDTPEYICVSYFDGQIPCYGGVLALNGKTGDTLWTHWTAHAIYSVDCGLDLTNDKIKDCIICGHGGILHAINGQDGSSIWEAPVEALQPSEDWKLADIYDAKFIADIDGDEVGDVIASHTIQSTEVQLSEILIISGINGSIIHSSILPNTEQLFLAPQKLVHPDGESIFVFVTTSQKQSAGGLYVVPQVNLMYGNMKLRKLHHDTERGTPLPPVLVDITLDGVEDIVAAMSNSTIIVYNGLTFEPIWNYTVPNSKVISIPIPGYYNDDNVPDFMVKHQIGSDFTTYNYTITTIVDGKTGKPLLEKPIEGSLSKQMSGLSVTVEGFGNDWFLHWSIECLNYEAEKEKYQSLKTENLIITFETRADICKLRFNSSLTTNLYALSQHVGPPGISLYFSDDLNSRTDAYADTPFVSQRSPKTYKSRNEKNQSGNMNKELDKSYGKYTSHNKFEATDFQNENPGNFNDDYTWKNENKWTQKNVESKDYDGSYYGESNINVGEEQSMDYSQADQIREQRSDTNSISITDSGKNINNSIDDVLSNESIIINETNTLEQFNNYVSNLDVEIDTESDMKTINLRKRTVDFNPNIMNNTNTFQEFVQTYTQKSPNVVENMEEDATIEKIFKRESLRNQNKEKLIKGNLKILAKLPNKVHRQKRKRETEIENNRMYRIYGIQKQPTTGILLPSTSESIGTTSVDLVFSTFVLTSSEIPKMLIQEDLDCIHRKKVLSEKKLQYKHEDDFVKECLAERGISYNMYQEMTDRENLKISFGQMTIYRMKLECACPEDMLPNESCKNISLHQSWSEYLGSHGNGYFKTLHKTQS